MEPLRFFYARFESDEQLRRYLELSSMTPKTCNRPSTTWVPFAGCPRYDEASWFSASSDVYMFGMFIYELVTGQVPFEELNLQDVLLAVSERHMRPVIPASTPSHLSSLMKRCWHDSPSARPSMLEVQLCG